ncbi:sensor histidine kinase [Umezawaea tangerina]|uniref:histidine kinase n=1 Tax=Umezawaea tangerina TaxID=84725 RepID=A0A2T0T1Z8_9PSEU|nr:histidine kinase [Umezawaea tangerina]PRY39698.1 signal transduction histidine kinase [Umezawaea tangerina]
MPTTWFAHRSRVVRTWWRDHDSAGWDRWLAVLFTVLAFVPALSGMGAEFGDLPRRQADLFSLVLVLAQTAPLAVRRTRPATCLAITGTAFAVHESLAYAPQFSTVTVYLALYSAGAHQRRFRRTTVVAATAAHVVLCLVLTALGSPDRMTEFLVFYLIFVAFWALGAHVRRQRAQEAERRRLAAIAATAAERSRIARELHDVVTHHVTAIVVQADATRFLAESPERVLAALTAMGGAGRQALAELRHQLDVLEATGESEPRSPVQGSVRDLVERIRTSGQPVGLIEDGDPTALPADVGLAVYRVVQEGLTNAVKYAAGQPTEVRTGYRDDRVEVEVTNTAAPVPIPVGAGRELSGGRGLTGLRDRVAALGGGLTAGEEPDGRFRLHAVIPIAGGA